MPWRFTWALRICWPERDCEGEYLGRGETMWIDDEHWRAIEQARMAVGSGGRYSRREQVTL